jgi:hypothetical protein
MKITFVGMFLGMLVGLAAAGPLGAVLGIALGGAGGLLVAGARNAVQQATPGVATVREEQRLLCMPKGQLATATFVRDAQDGRWLDVERCSLCTPEGEVGCEKRCLHMMRDTLPPRRHAARRLEPQPV